jgi:hypothetical protein
VVAARKQKQKRMSAQVVEDEDYQLRYEIAAGIDVAKESAVVRVRMPPAAGRKHRTSHLQTVPATVPAIGELAAELKAQGVQMVSMEATSDYWRVWFAVLEEAGLAVQLVNSSQARNLPGRPKTDNSPSANPGLPPPHRPRTMRTRKARSRPSVSHVLGLRCQVSAGTGQRGYAARCRVEPYLIKRRRCAAPGPAALRAGRAAPTAPTRRGAPGHPHSSHRSARLMLTR